MLIYVESSLKSSNKRNYPPHHPPLLDWFYWAPATGPLR